MTNRCIVLLGGSFDPVHEGHIALARHFNALFRPDELRIIPAGNPWQKKPLHASAQDRVAMLHCAFDHTDLPIVIDEQEIHRTTATYSIDTLRDIRKETGENASVIFVIGADQLQQFHTWREWQRLFDYAHICAASRPGFTLETHGMSPEAAEEFARRSGTLREIRTLPHGKTYLADTLEVKVSATEIRAMLLRGDLQQAPIPFKVLDYIKQHHLYQN